MPADKVVDASVIGAAFFNEIGSEAASNFLASHPGLSAPVLLYAEVASLAAKKAWRGEASAEAGQRALAALSDFITDWAGLDDLATPAFVLAERHRFSAYDAIYLALAEARKTVVVTLDMKLVKRLEAAGLSYLVEAL